MCRVFHFAAAFLLVTVFGCDDPVAVSEVPAPGQSENNQVSVDKKSSQILARPVDDSPESVLTRVNDFAEVEMPPAEFEVGHAEPIEPTELLIESTDEGYVITFPSGSPIPTPTIVGGRIYVSGGFSSESFHCLDLESGKPTWEMRLDDDGPSSGVPCDDMILLGTESCTMFALHQETGEMLWSAYLGDPLLSAPAAADGKLVTVYPAASAPPEAVATLADPETPQDESVDRGERATRIADLLEPTHIAICMDTATGKVQWRTWIDSDCLSAPVIAGSDVYITSLSGTIYQIAIEDGSVRMARRAMATSAPLVMDESIYVTRRREQDSGTVQEYLSFLRREDSKEYFAAASVDADYLQATIQMNAAFQDAAEDFEQMNGFGGGGFGGGFGGGQGNFGGGGTFQIPDDIHGPEEQAPQPEQPEDVKPDDKEGINYSVIGDLLGYTEVQAAENIGLGSASTIQGFAGSIPVGDSQHLYNTMGDRVVCTSRQSGEIVWTLSIDGDLKKMGGHLASPPVLRGDRLVIATALGKVIEIDAATGKAVELGSLDTQFRFRPAVTADAVVVTSQDGRLFYLKRSN